MRRYQKWVVTLGILAISQTTATAGEPLLSRIFKSTKTVRAQSEADALPKNQQMANAIAQSLGQAKLQGKGIQVRFQSGVALLTGSIVDEKQKAKATSVVSQVPGVQRVDNQLTLMTPAKSDQAGSEPQYGAIQQTAAFTEAPQSASALNNQQVAERIATALSTSSFNGYDVEIRFEKGNATLLGFVTTPEQRQHASEVVSKVPGVNNVNNQLKVPGAQRPPARRPMPPAAYGQQGPGGPGVPPQAYRQTAYQQGAAPAPGGMPPGMQAGYAHGGPGGGQPAYDSAHLPEYAWPAYAKHPNYAAVAYPKQYSASAWPYIGPYYPYPQVPLGWRQVQLEWDDGQWNLNFRPRTERWWWFMNPSNW